MDAALGTVTWTPTPPRIQSEDAVSAQRTSAAPIERRPLAPQEAVAALDAKLHARREVVSDPATDSLIYRMIDVSSGDVTSQTPSDARLRLRAYIDTVIAAHAAEATFEAKA